MGRVAGWAGGLVAVAVTGVVLAAGSPLDRPGDQPFLRLAAEGVQVYACRAPENGSASWAFVEPRANLFANGLPIGRHYAGPTWEHADLSRVTGRVVASEPSPKAGAIPWLRLAVVSRENTGVLTPATYVQRIDTEGGTLSGPCPRIGATQEVPYRAIYVFGRGSAE